MLFGILFEGCLVNKLFSCSPEENPQPPSSFSDFFDQDSDNIVTHNPEDLAKEIELISSQHTTEVEKDEAIASYMENKSKHPLSEIEEIRLYGISQVRDEIL